MRIPLSEFEQHVRPEPLERGLSLYEQGMVESIRGMGDGAVEAVLHDADGLWHPGIKIKDEAIVMSYCNCGQTGDSLCKHGIAVVFAMEAGQFKEGISTKSGKVPKEKTVGKRGRPKLDEEPVKKAPKAKPAKPPKAVKTASDIIARVPHEELVAFLLQECKLDKNIELRLKAHFADLLPATTPAEVEKRINETIKAAIGKSGKVNKGSMGVLVKRLDEWAKESGRMLEAQHFDTAFTASRLVVQAMVDLGDSPHAVDQDLKAPLKTAENTLIGLGKATIPEQMRAYIFASILVGHQGYRRNISYLRLASQICQGAKEFADTERLFALYHDDIPHVSQAHHEMVRRVLGQAAADEFAKKHANSRYFLMQEIDAARKEGNLQKALKSAQKGLSLNTNHPTRLGHWVNLVDEILAEMGDVDGRVELALRLHRLGYKTVKVSLKSITEVAGRERWIAERAKLLQDLDPKKQAQQELILQLYLVDQDMDGLQELIMREKLNVVVVWAANFSRRLPALFWNVITTTIEKIGGQDKNVTEYQWTDLIRHLVRIKGKEATTKFFREACERHPRSLVLQATLGSLPIMTRYMYEYD